VQKRCGVQVFCFFFFFLRSFLNRRSLGFLDCFTGQSPGIGRNELAISIPVAPAFGLKLVNLSGAKACHVKTIVLLPDSVFEVDVLLVLRILR